MPAEYKRHLFLTIYLWFIIVTSSIGLLIGLYSLFTLTFMTPFSYILIIITILAALNIMSALALLGWKKWGFWGLVISSVISGGINVGFHGDESIIEAISIVLSILLLYWALHMGGENKAWPRLK